ncbi:sterol O-acyltransferase 1 [Scaptodrosophila lebanonensis]|uniref:O-acyltransferase n=1 Tax=Drosophila lebanonensis TaxID=7225 RepID=A0A6J2TBV1_DROLE|nr:sterol O-acyltransferase 1 [Scaptodrosophila lebanonensis]
MAAEIQRTKPQAVKNELEDSELHFVCEKLQKFQVNMVRDFERQLSSMIEDVLQDMRQRELRLHEFRNFAQSSSNGKRSSSSLNFGNNNSTWHNRQQISKKLPPHDISDSPKAATPKKVSETSAPAQRRLPDKVFIARESYLTALLQVDHMRTIYHIFYIILVMFLLNVVLHDYFVEGHFNLGLGTFRSGLQRLHWVLGVWLLEHVFVLALYYAFRGWALVRHRLKKQNSLQRFWSHSCLIMYISSQLVFGYVSCTLCLKFRLPFVSACVLLLESTRLLMKMHAFVRYNAERVIVGKLKTDGKSVGRPFLPSLGCYVYFLFAPTLIYRDNYPRTSHIRWPFAISRLLEVVAIAFLYAFIHERHISEHFADYGREPLNTPQLIVKLFGMILPSMVIFLCGFYLILHSWLNFTSELLRFGDRMFYKDWWTSHTYDAYYRNWNVVVHDWLYEYVYRDVYTHVFKGSKVGASLTVFMISAMVHEQVLGFALRMFFPVMFVLFGVVGVTLVFLMRRAPKILGNIFLWFSLISGNGMLISLYAMEYYARQNCELKIEGWTDYVIPAAWRCYH